jgi:hypothetical protein
MVFRLGRVDIVRLSVSSAGVLKEVASSCGIRLLIDGVHGGGFEGSMDNAFHRPPDMVDFMFDVGARAASWRRRRSMEVGWPNTWLVVRGKRVWCFFSANVGGRA